MRSNNESKIPGYRNYDEWNDGFKLFMDYFRDSLKFIRCGGEGSKYHSDGENIEEMNYNFSKVVTKLVEGAIVLQYIRNNDFYYKNECVEIIIKFNQGNELLDMKPDKLLENVICILKSEEGQFERITNAFKND